MKTLLAIVLVCFAGCAWPGIDTNDNHKKPNWPDDPSISGNVTNAPSR